MYRYQLSDKRENCNRKQRFSHCLGWGGGPKIEDSSARLENVIGSVRLRQAAELATLMDRVIDTENVRISVRS